MKPRLTIPGPVITIILFLFLAGNSLAQPTIMEVSGDITGNTTWTEDTVKVLGDVTVQDNVVLTIEPGTTVKFMGYFGLWIRGRLLAEGQPGDTILFTMHDTTGFYKKDTVEGGWAGVRFDNGGLEGGANGAMADNDTSVMNICVIEFTKNLRIDWPYYTGGLFVENFSALILMNSHIRYCWNKGHGAGFTLNGGSPVLVNNSIYGCRSELEGGGMWLNNFRGTLERNTFYNNSSHKGGGVFLIESNATLKHNTFSRNRNVVGLESPGTLNGGGLYIAGSAIVVDSNDFFANESAVGGGIYIHRSNGVIRGNKIHHNITSSAAGIYMYMGELTLQDNRIYNNDGVHFGGGMNIDRTPVKMINNLILNNDANEGGGIFLTEVNGAVLLNNTVANNNALFGGGIAARTSNPELINTILWGNKAAQKGDQVHLSDNLSDPDIRFCIIEGGMEGITIGAGNYEGIFSENIDADPDFINPSPDAGVGHDAGQFQWELLSVSPAINTGNQTRYSSIIPDFDLAGEHRVLHGEIDMGVYETHIKSLEIAGTIDQDTLLVADTIKVTGNIVVPDDITLTIAPGSRVEFQGRYGMDILGTLIAVGTPDNPILFTTNDTTGFHNPDPDLKGWQGIKFDNGQYHGNGAMNDNDTSRIVNCIIEYSEIGSFSLGTVQTVYFSRLEISDNTFRFNRGGKDIGWNTPGIHLRNSDLYVRNNIFEENYGHNLINIGSGSPVFEGNILRNNRFYYLSSTGASKTTFRNNLIYENHLRYCAIHSLGTGDTILNNRILNNTIDEGPAHDRWTIVGQSNAVIMGNLITNNEFSGVLIAAGLTTSYLINNTIVNNGWYGITNENDKTLIYNNILAGNKQEQLYGSAPTMIVSNCLIEGGLPGWGNRNVGDPGSIVDADPSFVNPTAGHGVGYDALDADFSLLNLSAAINGGTNDPAGISTGSFDMNLNPRINDDMVDIGAFENQGKLPFLTLQPENSVLCEGDSVSLFIATMDTVSIQWQKDGLDIPGATFHLLVLDSITITDEGNYKCIARNSYGETSSTQVSLIVKQAPEIWSQPRDLWMEEGKSHSMHITAGGTPPISYKWQKDGSSIPGAGYPELPLIRMDSTVEGRYRAVLANSCGTDTSGSASVWLAPQICMVTVSPTTGHNLVVWEKKSKAPVIAYNIYRESVAAGIYDRLETIAHDDLSVFIDTTADPTVQAYLYKITAIDTAGSESDIDLCEPHKTIHLIVSTNPELNTTQLQWDRYYGFEYQTYSIYRSQTGLNFDPVHSLSASLNSWTDPEPSTGDFFYRIAVEKPDPCRPEGGSKKAGTGPYVHSLSNMDNNKLKEGQFPPDTISLDNHTINEEMMPGSFIGKFFTEDKDSVDSHTYSFVPGEGSDDNVRFTILGDLLLTSETFDYESENQFNIRIRSTDAAGNYIEVSLTIHVGDIDETTGLATLDAEGVSIYPNPFSNSTTISIPDAASLPYTLVLTDLSGKVYRIVEGIQTRDYTLQGSGMNPGMYFIELRGTKFYRNKILIR